MREANCAILRGVKEAFTPNPTWSSRLVKSSKSRTIRAWLMGTEPPGNLAGDSGSPRGAVHGEFAVIERHRASSWGFVDYLFVIEASKI